MKIGRKKPEPDELDKAIDKVHAEMTATTADSDDYAAMVKQLKKLYALRDGKTRSRRVSPDTLAMVAANIAVSIIVVGYEQKHVVSSKAKDFWLRFH